MENFNIIYKYKHAFSMLELIFVIVILGIVSSIGSSIIVQVYESYITQKAVHNASLKTELAINQLANRLTYRIDQSMLARKPANTGYASPADVYAIENVPIGDLALYSAIEWITYDNDGFSSSNPPTWSGFADLNASSFTTLSSTGSNLTQLQTVLNNIAGGGAGNPGLIFLGEIDYSSVQQYDTLCMYSNNGCISPLDWPTVNTNIPFTAGVGNRTLNTMVYTEMYQIVASAYAIVPVAAAQINGINVWDLRLFHDYQPWLGENYSNGDDSTLLRNVSVFRFKKEENSIRIKLCVIEQIGLNAQISICKEKAVIR